MRLRTLLVLALALLAGACADPIELPTGFVRLHDGGAGFRALTSDDARLWVRQWDDATVANVAFWVDVLQQDLVQRGYQVLGGGEAKDAVGETGRWLQCDANVRGERVHYLIGVWAAGGTVQVVEYGASGDVFAKHLPAVKAALATVRR